VRLNPNPRTFAAAGALSLVGLGVLPHASVGADSGTPIKITDHRLHVVSGQKAAISGVLDGGQGRTAQLERRTGGGWHVEDRDRANTGGKFSLGFRPSAPGSTKVRVRFPAGQSGVAAATPVVGPVVRSLGSRAADTCQPARSALPPRRCRAARRSPSTTATAPYASPSSTAARTSAAATGT
jgi:hypothetical protein